jgi:peptide/nickel transport system substrate-binding protein
MLATDSASHENGGLTPLQFKRQTDTYKTRRDFRKYKYLAFAYTYWGII